MRLIIRESKKLKLRMMTTKKKMKSGVRENPDHIFSRTPKKMKLVKMVMMKMKWKRIMTMLWSLLYPLMKTWQNPDPETWPDLYRALPYHIVVKDHHKTVPLQLDLQNNFYPRWPDWIHIVWNLHILTKIWDGLCGWAV